MGSFAVSLAASFDSGDAANVAVENRVAIKANVEIFFHVRFLFYIIIFIERSLYQGTPYLPALNWMSQIRRDEYLTKVVQILLKFVLSFSPKPCLSMLVPTHRR